jgi:hypothetical protein
MLADPLMKGLPPNIFREHVAGMGLLEALWFWNKGTIKRTTPIKKNVIHFEIGWYAIGVEFQQYFIDCCNTSL